MKIDLEQIRNLLDVLGQTDITELTIEQGEEKITIKKSNQASALVEFPSFQPPKQLVGKASFDVDKDELEPKESSNNLISITAPMVGTFYRSPSPTAAPFVDVGDMISPGQTICIIEAMKLMNDLPAEISGRVVKICVENGTTVEYGQPLFMVNPQG